MLSNFRSIVVLVVFVLAGHSFYVSGIPTTNESARSSNPSTNEGVPVSRSLWTTSFMLTVHDAVSSTLSSPSKTILKPRNLIIFIALSILLASVFKSLQFVPLQQQSRVDQALTFFITCLISIFFIDRILDASAAGHLSLHRFLQYFLAGGICAFVTHALCTPIDVVKTRIQTKPGRYTGMIDAFYKIVSDEGPLTLLKGLGATASGYFLHGAFKYSFYEVFKLLFSPSPIIAVKPPLPIAALSGFLAECIACIFLCPLEAIRIRSVADSNFPTGVLSGLSLLFKSEGIHGLFKGLIAMLLKQVPYTVGQFVSFEFSVKVVRTIVHATVGIQDAGSAVAFISSAAGLLAGIAAAIVSHPGDTILSKINQDESDAAPITQIIRVVRTTGFLGIFVGLGPRLIQVSCMIGGQFMIYDSIKLWCGIVPASALPVHDHIEPLDIVAPSSAETNVSTANVSKSR